MIHEMAAAWTVNGGIFLAISISLNDTNKKLSANWALAGLVAIVIASLAGMGA